MRGNGKKDRAKKGAGMKRVTGLMCVLVLVAVMTSGCAMCVNPLVGTIYSDDVSGAVTATEKAGGSKIGESTATLVFGVSFGDASIQTAAANGGIDKIKTVDVRVKNVLGIFMEQTTIVTGD